MYSESKKTHLVILGITAIIFSRAMFAFFNDPEGPNLLIVMVMASIVYTLSLIVDKFLLSDKQHNRRKLLFMISIQIIIVASIWVMLTMV